MLVIVTSRSTSPDKKSASMHSVTVDLKPLSDCLLRAVENLLWLLNKQFHRISNQVPIDDVLCER